MKAKHMRNEREKNNGKWRKRDLCEGKHNRQE